MWDAIFFRNDLALSTLARTGAPEDEDLSSEHKIHEGRIIRREKLIEKLLK